MVKNSEKLSVGFLFDDTLDSDDGVAQYVKNVGAWLSQHGHEVQYFVGETELTEWSGGRVHSLAKNLPVSFNGNRLSIPLPANRRRLKQSLSSQSLDVLHVMVPYSPFMAQKVINLVPKQVAVVGTFHIYPSGWLSRTGGRLLRFVYGRSLRRFGHIVSVSSASATFARRTFGIKSDISPNPVNLSQFVVKNQKPQSNRIVFLGRLVRRKGAHELIKAFARLLTKIPEAELVIAGKGAERANLEKLARQLGVADGIKFLGYISEEAKPKLLASASVACFPSLYGEAFGVVLIEAMAAGAGVVLGGDNPGYRSVLGDQSHLLVNPSDTVAFAARLESLLTDKPLHDKLHAWQTQAVKQYDINVVGSQLLKVYMSAIARLDKNSHNYVHESRNG